MVLTIVYPYSLLITHVSGSFLLKRNVNLRRLISCFFPLMLIKGRSYIDYIYSLYGSQIHSEGHNDVTASPYFLTENKKEEKRKGDYISPKNSLNTFIIFMNSPGFSLASVLMNVIRKLIIPSNPFTVILLAASLNSG